MTQPVSMALVAVGGYGKFYVQALLDKTDPAAYRIEGVVDPFAQRCARLDELKARNIPIYDTLEEFYARHGAELVTIASPIPLHCPQTCEALAHGSHVLCEKPLGGAIQEAARMIEGRDRAGRFVAIGYQWSYSEAIQALKKDIMEGRFGRPIRLKTLVLWPRNEAYYARNAWAGAKDNGQGAWILDSPVNNATAHYLHNMFYVLGERAERSARPVSVAAELFRANRIANYDTSAARIAADNGAELLYYASHAVKDRHGPEFLYEFENGSVYYEDRGAAITARFGDGSTKAYGNPYGSNENKLWDCLKAVRGEKAILCPPEAARSQTLCVNGMQESMPEIIEFPKSLVRVEGQPGERFTFVEGLNEDLTRCYRENKLPSELGLSWARAGTEIDLTNYTHFPRESRC